MKPERKLVSLFDLMWEYKLGDLAKMWTAVLQAERDLRAGEALGHDKPPTDHCSNLAIVLDGLAICCGQFEADPSLIQQVQVLSKELAAAATDTRCPVLGARLRTIIQGVQENLDSRKFLFIPKDDVRYWENDFLFGQDFMTVFPVEASFELREMGKCFAASRATAAVFHAMRIAEYGLRILAKRVRVQLVDRGKPIPIEYGTWDKVIQGVRNKIIEIRRKPIGPQKEKALQFYSSAADQCEYMKDIWRNEIAHSRHRFYSREETLGVIGRVGDFARVITEHEIPKDKKKHLAKIQRRIQELRRSYGDIAECVSREDQSQAGRGESAENRTPEA